MAMAIYSPAGCEGWTGWDAAGGAGAGLKQVAFRQDSTRCIAGANAHLGRLLQPVAGLADAAVQNELLHPNLPHRVGKLLVGLRQRQPKLKLAMGVQRCVGMHVAVVQR